MNTSERLIEATYQVALSDLYDRLKNDDGYLLGLTEQEREIWKDHLDWLKDGWNRGGLRQLPEWQAKLFLEQINY